MREYFYSIESDCVYTRSQYYRLELKGELEGEIIYLGWYKSARQAYSWAFWAGLTRKDVQQ